MSRDGPGTSIILCTNHSHCEFYWLRNSIVQPRGKSATPGCPVSRPLSRPGTSAERRREARSSGGICGVPSRGEREIVANRGDPGEPVADLGEEDRRRGHLLREGLHPLDRQGEALGRGDEADDVTGNLVSRARRRDAERREASGEGAVLRAGVEIARLVAAEESVNQTVTDWRRREATAAFALGSDADTRPRGRERRMLVGAKGFQGCGVRGVGAMSRHDARMVRRRTDQL